MLNAIRAFLIWSAIIMRQLTWPGSFFRELAHQLACYAAGHKVLEVRYIIRNDPNSVVGYVRHRGPPGMGRELFIGIVPLLLGLAIWAGYIGVAVYLTRDGSLGLVDTLIVVAATLVTANATYHALPSPQDMENVFKQPFSLPSLPCYVIAGPVWVVGHNYRWVLWGWTQWHVVVVLGTIYALYSVVAANLLPVLPDLPRPV